ncbi:MAG: amidohydrolase/deacetylase family metallohydrolase [SAR202 cluster bacterium]|nr:amidohydrolase/deacetylase family metallohydrolase [SAR202 cluster bacterium]
MYDLMLKGGRVFDAAQGIAGKRMDVAVSGGIIAKVAPDIAESAARVLDVSGKIVAPGLIDLHCHVYEGVNQTGVDPDLVGVRSGVTTVVDGGSAGFANFGGFPAHVAPKAKTRVLCFVHIARNGLSTMPEIGGRGDIDVEETVKVVRANKPLVQGVKVRAIGPAVPSLGVEMVKLALQAASQGGVRLMVHIGDLYIREGPTLTQQLLPLLRKGDILTHTFTGNLGRIVDAKDNVLPELFAAQERGVTLDTAMGRFNFSFEVARRALDQGVKPKTLATDITVPGRLNTVHSMTEMMTRFLALGSTVADVIAMATANPAAALGMEATLGSLAPGRVADITVLNEVSGKWRLRDTVGSSLTSDKALAPASTVRAGEVIMPDWGPHPWGWLPEQA